jgi:hypothetical protein
MPVRALCGRVAHRCDALAWLQSRRAFARAAKLYRHHQAAAANVNDWETARHMCGARTEGKMELIACVIQGCWL